jgi:uncharacterized membrane protein
MLCRQSGMRRLPRHQRGAVAVVVGLMMVVLVGVAAFTVDFGRWLIVRNELQNGADASALAGAGYLLNPPVSGKPNWVLATAQAQQAVALNRSERMALQSADVTPGIGTSRPAPSTQIPVRRRPQTTCLPYASRSSGQRGRTQGRC